MPCSKNKSIFSKSNFLKRKSNDKHYLETNSDSMKELLHDTLELKSDNRTKKQDSSLLENNTNLKAKPSEYHETSHEKNSKSQEAESKKCYASSPESNNNFQPRSLYTSKWSSKRKGERKILQHRHKPKQYIVTKPTLQMGCKGILYMKVKIKNVLVMRTQKRMESIRWVDEQGRAGGKNSRVKLSKPGKL